MLRTAFHGVPYPSTLGETGSDLHRVYLARLCYAFRFSQPLDASFRPNPTSPCFMRETPLGFLLTEVFPLRSRGEPHSLLSLHAVSHRDFPHRQAGLASTTPQLQGFALSENPFRQTRCYPTDADRSSPSLVPLRGFHPSGLDPVLPRTLLSWALRLAGRQAAHLDAGSAEFQRTRRLACLFRELPTSLRFPSSTAESRGTRWLLTS
jgi:hypothetical protein